MISLGIAMILPVFFQTQHSDEQLKVLLSFSVIDESNKTEWCRDLSFVLNRQGVRAAVFVTGKVAYRYPECVTVFGSNIDIGSQTYSYVDLTSIPDYTVKLEEVKKGKEAIDNAGKLYSRLFKAPYGSTDDDIYSLLSRSDILADFSYDRQYNKYHNGQFIRFDLTTIDESANSANPLKLIAVKTPILINFDDSTPVEQINYFISRLKSSNNIRFINASELTGLDLTLREGERA